jgi:Tfp pilus assembly protein PilN
VKTHLNLLPWKCRQAQTIRLRLRQWALPWAAALAALGLVFVVESVRYHAAKQRMEQLEEQYAPVELLRTEIAGLRDRQVELDHQKAVLSELETPHPALTLLGFVSKAARGCGGQVQVESLAMASAGGELKSSGKTGPAVPTGKLGAATIRGVAADNLAIARFVAALRQSEAFDRVELKSSEKRPTDHRPVCAFLVECSY